ncbi:MAG: AAA family ATPase [Zetaproteobacteria bacterium]|nr:AAA family ATPase [Zetaproteobacteria bacterium]
MDYGINPLFEPNRHPPKRDVAFERVVLTSGPGCGKTSVTIGLEYLGYQVLREAAADYIHFRKAQGSSCPWKEDHFQDEISLASIKRENQQAAIGAWHFQDRSLIDCLGFYEFTGKAPAPLVAQEFAQTNLRQRYFPTVFLLEDVGERPLEGLRIESVEESRQISAIIQCKYQELGYTVVQVAKAPLSDRIQWILDYLEQHTP